MGLFNLFKKKKMYLYSETELDEYEAFITKNFGSYEEVFHEIVSPDIHLDIIVVPPTEENPFYKLVTMGVGAYKMHVPEELKQYELEHMELVMYLPKEWNVKSSEEKDYWPIRYMKILGRLPITQKTWLGVHHTVQANAEESPFAENTNLNNILLMPGMNLKYDFLDLRLSSGKKINFYQMFPIYQEELEYKNQYSVNELIELFEDEDIIPVLNLSRRNYGKTTE